MTTITIHGPLQGKGRPRFANGHAYTPEATKRYEGMIQGAYLLAHGERLDGPVALDVTACQALPKRAGKAARMAAESGSIKPLGKPDIDNIVKIVMDALNGYAYQDDTQVVQLDARKEYAADGVSRLVVSVKGIKEHVHDECKSEG